MTLNIAASTARKGECQWEIQGIPSSVWKEDFGCMEPTTSCCKCERRVPSSQSVDREKVNLIQTEHIFKTFDNFDFMPSLNNEPISQV